MADNLEELVRQGIAAEDRKDFEEAVKFYINVIV
jgi:hypothetical protein